MLSPGFRRLVVLAPVFVACVSPGTRDSIRRPAATGDRSPVQATPLILTTDLFAPANPPNDPDDHFDLATAYAIAGLDLRAVILDNPDGSQRRQSGTVAVDMMNAITHRQVPAALGVTRRMRTPDDTVSEDPSPGPQHILDTIRSAPRPVAIAIVGSARDIMVAFNRSPALFRQKVSRILASFGDADSATQEPPEHNVALDPQAIVALLRSGLPVDWVPCFDGGVFQVRQGRASWWVLPQEGIALASARPEVQQYFLDLMFRTGSETPCPGQPPVTTPAVALLSLPVAPEYQRCLFALRRNLWDGPIFAELANLSVTATGELVPLSSSAPLAFTFDTIRIGVDDLGHVAEGGPYTVRRFRRLLSDADYAQAMNHALGQLLASLGRHAQ